MMDTTPKQQARYYELLRARTVEDRAQMVFALSEMVRRLAIAGIRLRHPGIGDSELRARLAVRLYGRAQAKRLLGSIPADAR